jgi:putative DNA primase/helicase
MDAGGRLYRYKTGVYVPDGEELIARSVKHLLDRADKKGKWTSKMAKDVAEYIRADAPKLWPVPPLGIVNVANGLLDVEKKTLSAHTPDHLSTIQLPVNFGLKAKCPIWDAFIERVFPADAQMLAYELIAWLMIPYTQIQKAILLIGEGSNGKSTFLRAMIRFLGEWNISSLSLQKLEIDRFAPCRLIGKLANVCPDLPNTSLQTTSVFKAITGGDILIAEYKFRDSFDFKPFARLVFSANEVPPSSDKSDGFYRRLVIVPFEQTFKEDAEVGRRLDAWLAEPEELSGVLNKALEALPGVRAKGLTISESIKAAHSEYRKQSDPLAAWLDANTKDDPDGWVARARLYDAYAGDCRNEGRATMTQVAFGRRLRLLRRQLTDTQRTEDGKITWAIRESVWSMVGRTRITRFTRSPPLIRT